VADHYDSASGLTLTASRADLLKSLAQSQPRSYGAGDTFLTVPYRPILARLDCHAWLSAIVQATASAPIAGHSIRTFCYARLLAGHESSLNDAAYDEDLLFAACVMHDLGLGTLATGQARFEVEGADLAATVLTEHGVAAPEVDRVWEAIALHSSAGIAHRRGLLTYLTHRGVFIDSGRDTGLPAGLIQRVRTAYPHRAGKRYLADAIADHASRSQAAAPPGSLGSELLRQRRAEQALER
jgi:hypothetical protein